jgi:hypothetical protein
MVFASVDPAQGEQFEQAYRKVSAGVLGPPDTSATNC